MTLGGRIYELRSRCGLSQEELAEKLSVSRQSVSKWETDTSVPELEKLIGLSQIFGVSLDELARGEEAVHNEKAEENKIVQECSNKNTSCFPARKIVGTILACTGAIIFLILTFLAGVPGGLLFSVPFFACAVICFAFEKRTFLWCMWAVYFYIDAYMRNGTAVNRNQVFHTHIWTPSMNYMILIIAWVLMLALFGLTVWTLISYRKYVCKPDIKVFCVIGGSIVVCVLMYILQHIIGENMIRLYTSELSGQEIRPSIRLFSAALFLIEWGYITVFQVVAVKVSGVLRFVLMGRKSNN